MSKSRRDAQPTVDDALGITSARELGITRQWTCGCAEITDASGVHEQLSLMCDGREHKARRVFARARGAQGLLF